jgi:hypothetical protein
VLGFRLSWRKGHRGTEVPWSGALVSADHLKGTVTITLPEEKRIEAQACIANLRSQGTTISRRDLRLATGKFEWVAGMLPQLRPFTQTLWAALSSTDVEPEKARGEYLAVCALPTR